MIQDKELSRPAIYLLQGAYASSPRTAHYDLDVLRTLGFSHADETKAIAELQAAGLIEKGEFRNALRPTDAGWALVGEMWPNGQLAYSETQTVVIGAFDTESDLPVRLAVPATDLLILIPKESRFALEIERYSLRCRAWELVYPPTGAPGDRILVRVEEGTGEVVESLDECDAGDAIGVGAGTWLSVDRQGRCRESHRSLEEMVFLIAMGAA